MSYRYFLKKFFKCKLPNIPIVDIEYTANVMASLKHDLKYQEEISFDAFIVADVVLVEDFKNLNKGLKTIFKKNKPLPGNDLDRIDLFFASGESKLNRNKRIFNFFTVEITDKHLKQFIKRLEISIENISNSVSILYFKIVLNEEFKKSLLQTIQGANEEKRYDFLAPAAKKNLFNFKKWGVKYFDEENMKSVQIEDHFLKVKDELFKYLKKVGINSLFNKNTIVPPSVEVYDLKLEEIEIMKNKYNSLGFDSFKNNFEIEKHLIVYYPEEKYSLDNNIRFFYSNNQEGVDLKPYGNELSHYIFRVGSDEARYPLILNSLELILKYLDEKLSNLNSGLEKSYTQKRPLFLRYRFINKLRNNFARDSFLIVKLKNQVTEDNLNFIKKWIYRMYEDNDTKNKNITLNKYPAFILKKYHEYFNLSDFLYAQLNEQWDILRHDVDNRRQTRSSIISLLSMLIALATLIVSYITYNNL